MFDIIIHMKTAPLTFFCTSMGIKIMTLLLREAGFQQTWMISSGGMTHVHVHPELMLLADISNAVQGVKGTLNCGSSCAADNKRHCALETNSK